MLIIEGPDGSGKSTLAGRLSNKLDIPLRKREWLSDDHRGPIMSPSEYVDNDLLNWGTEPLHIYDRYPLISELVYGPVLRGNLDYRMGDPKWLRARYNTLRSMCVVIWCIPPLNTVIKNVEDQSVPQMEGVREEIETLWFSYNAQASMYSGVGMIYDYTNDNNAQTTHLFNIVRRHVNSWRHL
jgi:hypothetical protein